MPKRNNEDEIEYINWKIRKLKKKLKRSRGRKQHERHQSTDDEHETVGAMLDSPRAIEPNDDTPQSMHIEPVEVSQLQNSNVPTEPTILQEKVMEVDPAKKADEEPTDPVECLTMGLDPELLDILGDDPSAVDNYGPEIHKELATRLQHIATQGLTKETRKELIERYLIPANSTLIGAPILNAEIKAAITETVVKRDKGIEARQSQLAAAISGLARVLTKELEDKHKNNERLKQLMDVCRILCNIQHAESITRRNFAIFSIKRDLKEHLMDAKIDNYLFGKNLADTIKSANAVTRSGTDIKNKIQPKTKPFPPANNLNWRSPAPARKQQGAQRGREAAPLPVPGHPARHNRNVTQGNSSKMSRRPSKPTRRR